MELCTRERERKLLAEGEAAAHRIEEGAYGYCEEAGEPIGLGRPVVLRSRPFPSKRKSVASGCKVASKMSMSRTLPNARLPP